MSQNGSEISHTIGHRTSASSASGQHTTSSSSHSRNFSIAFALSCPYRTVESAIEHFDAGRMMYVEPASMQKFKKDLGAFVDTNSG